MNESQMRKLFIEYIHHMFFAYIVAYRNNDATTRWNCYLCVRSVLHLMQNSGLFSEKDIKDTMEDILGTAITVIDALGEKDIGMINDLLNADEERYIGFVEHCERNAAQEMAAEKELPDGPV